MAWPPDVFAWSVQLLKALVVFVAARLALRVGGVLIERALALTPRRVLPYLEERRTRTLDTLLKSLLRYTVDVVAGITILELFGVPIGGLLAGAGIAGLTIGFGAQHLVRDVITGFFILLEDQYAVGDYIKVGGFAGTVEEIGLRVTRLRDFSGELHVVPNGKVDAVTNLSRGNLRAQVDVAVAYEEDIDRVVEILRGVCAELAAAMPDVIREGPEVLGVVQFGRSEVVLRVQAHTVPLQHWQVERELRRRIKRAFEAAGIEIPYPRQMQVPYARS